MRIAGNTGVGSLVYADTKIVGDCISHVEKRFEVLLSSGAQAAPLPPGSLAAGQYLDQFSFDQRGLFGTAAALLVFSRAQPGPDRLRIIDALVEYLRNRRTIEESLATPEGLPVVRARLAVESRDTFKSADLLYALSMTPAAAVGRDHLIRGLLSRISEGRRSSGGWGVELDGQAERDVLATAQVVRALYVAGVAVEEREVLALKADAEGETGASQYVRTAVLLTLSYILPEDRTLRAVWKRLRSDLQSEATNRTEANYEYTIDSRHYYVRIPWQLYLVATAATFKFSALMISPTVRRLLLDCIGAVRSTEGFSYKSSGHAQSTRTNAIVVETLWTVGRRLRGSPVVSIFCATVNAASRVLQSRSMSLVLLLAGSGLAVAAAASWLGGGDDAISSLGPALVGAALLALAGASIRRLRGLK